MKTQRIGAIEIALISEIERLPVETVSMFGPAAPELVKRNLDWLGPRHIDLATGSIILSFHGYVLRTRHHTIVLDTCIGNFKNRPTQPDWHMMNGPYLDNLAAQGVRPEDVDYVMCTHLHGDHVGWNTRMVNGEWVPTFPNAKYVIARTEFEHYDRLHKSGPALPVNRGSWIDSVLPVYERGLVELVDMSHSFEKELGEGIWFEGLPGHTPGSVVLHVNSGGDHAILSGDIIHHWLQLAHPDLAQAVDIDPAQSARSRRKLLGDCADTGTLLLTGHFPSPTAGRVVSHGDAFRFAYQDGV